MKVSKGAKIRNRYNQVPHLTQELSVFCSRGGQKSPLMHVPLCFCYIFLFFEPLVVVPKWQDSHIENGSIIEFSSNNLLTEDLIEIKYMRHLVYTSLQHLLYCFSDIKYCMEHALLLLILHHFKIKNQYNRPYK